MKTQPSQKSYYASLEWQQDIPLSLEYNDYYFSKNSAIAESRYVFIEHNFLPQRFAALKEGQVFTIGETGFGAGRNFLNTLNLWRAINPSATLHYISIEKHPLAPADLARILAMFPELDLVKSELLEQYYLPLPGFHRLTFSGSVYLTLIIADATDALVGLEAVVDAWFLDGFSPAKNEQIWTQNIIGEIKRLSMPQTTFATYSASSNLRINLSTNGFLVHKAPGFGGKRDMLYGHFQNYVINSTTKRRPRNYLAKPPVINDKHVIVIGGGISGAASAHSLAQRGYQVTLIEQNSAPAQQASGNYQGMLYGTWSAFGGAAMELSFAGYRYSHNLIQQLLEPGIDFDNCGLIQLAHNPEQLKRQQQLLQSALPSDFLREVNHQQISELLGLKLETQLPGLYFPYGLWLNPPQLVARLLQHSNIQVITNCKVHDLVYQDHFWHAIDENLQTCASAATVVLCNSYNLRDFTPTRHLQLRTIRGQITVVPAQSQVPKTVLCGAGYLTPPRLNKVTIGATFQFNDEDSNVRDADHLENLANFSELLPNSVADFSQQPYTGKAGIRSSSFDYLPLVGPVADYQQFKQTYSKLSQDKNAYITANCPYLPGLFINVAHGTKGMLTAPICGEIIADYIAGTPLAASKNLREALHPNRYYVRELVKPLK